MLFSFDKFIWISSSDAVCTRQRHKMYYLIPKSYYSESANNFNLKSYMDNKKKTEKIKVYQYNLM